VTKKGSEKRSALVVVCLTEDERNTLGKLADRWDIEMALLVRRLIQYFIESKLSLPEFLERHRVPGAVHKTVEPKNRKIGVHLRQEEKQALSLLAYRGFHLPGEAAGILVKLFIAGAIKDGEIWK
jgi:hypothetical protein